MTRESTVIIMAALVALVGCSKPEDRNAGKVAAAEDQAGSVSHAKPEQPEQAAKKRRPSAWDEEMRRSREDAPPRRPWGGK